MKKETVLWVIVVVLIVGQAVLFTLHMSKNYKCKYKYKYSHSKKDYGQWGKDHHRKMIEKLCESCRVKLNIK